MTRRQLKKGGIGGGEKKKKSTEIFSKWKRGDWGPADIGKPVVEI